MLLSTREEVFEVYDNLRKTYEAFTNFMIKEGLIMDDNMLKNIITPEKICELVNDEFKINIQAKNRKQNTIFGRQAAAHILREFTPLSLSEIAPYIGVGDHTTVLHHTKKCYDMINTEDWFKEKVEKIKMQIEKLYLNLRTN